jgi:rhamnogalacturonyl hydrolase YesR
MLTSILAAVVLTPDTDDRRRWGLDALSVVRREFRIEGAPGYADAIGDGTDSQPVFNWGAGVLMSALNAAARTDPAWKAELSRFVEATRAYWNPAGPVAGYDVLPVPKPADRYYDDNAWMVLALVEAHDVTGRPEFLDYAKGAFAYVLSGEDDKLGGGIYWREKEKASKNTCSNAPSIAACLAVYLKTNDPTLLETAKRLYAWTKKNLQDPSDSLFWDSIALSGKLDKTKWSYNSALMIRSAAELARLTGDRAYKDDAEAIASASEKKWLVNGRVADVGRFAHLLIESFNYVPTDERRKKVAAALKWLHEHGRNEKGLYGSRFDLSPSPYNKRFELLDQASAARAFLVAR